MNRREAARWMRLCGARSALAVAVALLLSLAGQANGDGPSFVAKAPGSAPACAVEPGSEVPAGSRDDDASPVPAAIAVGSPWAVSVRVLPSQLAEVAAAARSSLGRALPTGRSPPAQPLA